ncbi:hypothetical protein CP02DC14_2379B, partial [Chlamydia psittaci 02DC14]
SERLLEGKAVTV